MKSLIAFIVCSILSCAPLGYADNPKHRIGVLLPLTGDFASYGAVVRKGVESVKLPDIEWVFEDEACDPARTITGFKKLTSFDKLQFIIGPCCGSPQKAVAPLLIDKEILVLLPNAAPESVFRTSGQRMYSAQYSLETEGNFMAQAMNRRGLKRVALVMNDNDFSRTLEDGFRKGFSGSIVFTEHAPGFDVQQMKSIALKLKGINFDSLFIPDAGPLLLGFLSEMKKIGIPRRATFSVYAAQMPDVLTAEKDAVEGLLYSYPEVPGGEDAFAYFPALAASTMAKAVSDCAGKYECVAKKFSEELPFSYNGTLKGKIVLKSVRQGTFVALPDDEI